MSAFKQLLPSLLLFLKGMAMGAADVVPGVSGGTVAFITGIYEELLNSIKSITPGLFGVWRREGFAVVWQRVNGTFLITLLSGIAVSVISLARVISHLLAEYPELLWSFFFGLILVSSLIIGRQINDKSWRRWAGMGVGAVIAFGITIISPAEAAVSWWFIFVAGSIAICAMILPGISGSFILLLFGMYGHVITAIKTLDIVFLAVFAGGCLAGLLSFSHVLSWMFKRYHDLTLAILTGFMVGSLNKVWPWKHTVSTRVNSHGMEVPLIQENVLPTQFEILNAQDPQLLACIGLMVLGFIGVYGLERGFRTND
ncbi:MAG: DUF368 domain-containing protein [Pseudomonadales bacterium]|nr:DUF368 domain-containing protein [Pseudomonadales bacterium]